MQTQQAGQGALKLRAGHDGVNKPFLLQIFSGLEIVWKLFTQRLLDHAAPGEADQCLRFRQD